MTPRTKGNLAFAMAALCAVYAFGGYCGMATILIVGRKAVDYPALYPPLAIVLTVATFYLLRYRKIMRRIEHGHCVRCDYDLRATPDRCPECGWVPKNSASR